MDTTNAAPDLRNEVRSARNATYVAFIGAGFGFATWASRIPQIRDALAASPSTLGLVLLAVAVGSLIALPLAGIVVTHLGTARTVASWRAASPPGWSSSLWATSRGCCRWWSGCS
jgi:hydrogenase/urease accessory protein HupE